MHIHVITYALDHASRRDQYMLAPILSAMEAEGHIVSFSRGVEERPPPADLAIMHVDLTVVPPEYREFAASFPKCINVSVEDISKRRISDALLTRDSAWDGRVLVKADLNCCGIPEHRAGLIAHSPNPSTRARHPGKFSIYPTRGSVPARIADDPALVVERFVPETVDDLFACRFWTFSGHAERCARVFTRDPIVKASGQIRFEFCEVPEQLREKRAQLGFDYGKFDFVVHGGEVILLDANKTPGTPPVSRESQWPVEYARGLLDLAR